MKIQLSPEKFQEILSKGYSLDHICVLKMVEEGVDISKMMEDSPKVAVLYQSLLRKGLIFDDNKLSIPGRELLVFVDSKESKRIKKPVVESSEFSLWWECYPRTDTFEYRGKKFIGSRGLRVAKDDCRTKFNKIMLEGEYTKDQLIKALQLDVYQKKEKSYQTASNKLSYMQNSLTYLNQRSFEPFLELIETGVKIEETPKLSKGATDV